MKEMRIKARKRHERQKLLNAIDLMLSNIDEEKEEYWRNRLFKYFCRRLDGFPNTDWLEFLGEMTDYQICCVMRQEKMKRYSIMLRNTAKWLAMRNKMEPKLTLVPMSRPAAQACEN